MSRPNKTHRGVSGKRLRDSDRHLVGRRSALRVECVLGSRPHSQPGLLAGGRRLLDRRRDSSTARTVALTLSGAVVLVAFFLKRGGTPLSRRKLARCLLLCGSLAIGFLLAEAASALRLRLLHSASAVPAGGLRQASRSKPSDLRPADADKVHAPDIFPDADDDRQIDIAVVGESSAEGVPFNRWTSIGHILQWQLGKIFPDRGMHVQVVASSGHTLQGQQELLARLSRRPEILIIYCGHNEVSNRVESNRDTRHYFDEQLPTAWSRVRRTGRGVLSSVRSDARNGGQVPGRHPAAAPRPPCRGRRTGLHDHRVHRPPG